MSVFSVQSLSPPQVRALYYGRLQEDFPPDEIKTLGVIERAMSRGEYFCLGAMAGADILAYAFFVKVMEGEREIALFDYYAVKKEARCMGVGSAFLQELTAGPLKNMKAVLLEIDDPACAPDAAEEEIRNRRLRFYLRNGLTDTAVTATVWGVQFRILALPVGVCPSPDETRRMYAALYHAIMPPEMYANKVMIHGSP